MGGDQAPVPGHTSKMIWWHKLDLMGEGWGWDQLGGQGRGWVWAKVSWERGRLICSERRREIVETPGKLGHLTGFVRNAIPWSISFVTRRRGHQPTLKGWVSGLIQSQEHTYLIMIIKKKNRQLLFVPAAGHSNQYNFLQINHQGAMLWPQILPYCEIIIACNVLCAVNFPSTKSCLIFKYMYPCVLMHVFSQPYTGTKLLVHVSM